MTTDLPLSANWLLNVYVNDVNAIRFDDERLRAIDAAIDEHNVAIEALKAERGALRAAQEERIEARNRQLCTALHVKLDEDGCPVRRQGPPKKERAAEPPALVSPTPDLTNPNVIGAMAALVPTPGPTLANLVNDAERGLSAAGVPISGYTPDGAPFGSGASGGGVVQVFSGAIGSLPGEMTTGAEEATREVPMRGVLGVTPERLIAAVTGHTIDGEIADASAADAFIDAVSEPERTLLRNGFSAEEIADMKPAMQQKLRELGYKRDSVHETGKGVWEEAPF